MKIRVGYELIHDCPQPTAMILTLSIHFTRVSDIVVPDHLIATPSIPIGAYRNVPRIGRVLIARGRDAADVPIVHSFGPNTLTSFRVWTDEVQEPQVARV